MGVRLSTEAQGFYLDTYKIEVIDTAYAGAVIPFRTNLMNAAFNYNGVSQDLFHPIKTTEFTFTLEIKNADHLAFWTAMAGANEKRFYCKVYLETAPSTYTPIYMGHLVLDQSLLPNVSAGRFIGLKSGDGLYRITDQEFMSDTVGTDFFGDILNDIYAVPTEYYKGYETLIRMIFKCLQGVGTLDLYDVADPFLLVNIDWYESLMADMLASPLEYARVRHEIWTERTEDGDYFTHTRAEVLRRILSAFNATISYSWGSYIIESIEKKGDNSKTFKAYNKAGTALADVTLNPAYHLVGYPFAGGHVANAGGSYGWVPPIRSACVRFDYNIKNYGAIPNSWNNSNTDLLELGEVIIEDEQTAIHFRSLIRYTPYDTGVPDFDEALVQLDIYFGVKIKYGDYWWITEVTNVGIPDTDPDGNGVVFNKYNFLDKWSATEDTYKFLVKQQVPWSAIKDNEYQVTIEGTTLPLRHIYSTGTTPAYALEEVHPLSVSIEFIKVAVSDQYEEDYLPGDPVNSELNNIDVEWRSVGALFFPTSGGETPADKDVAIKACVINNKDNSTKVERIIDFGDVAFNSNNSIQIYDGAEWVPSGQSWGRATLAGTKKLQDLLLEEVVASQPYLLSRYIGSFRGMLDNRLSIRYDGINYVPFLYTFGLFYREWDGEFYQAVRDPQSVIVTTSGIKADATGTLSSSGVVGTPAGSAPPQNVYPFKFTGSGSRTIAFGDIPLPDPAIYTTGQLDYLVTIYRGGGRIWYGNDRDIAQFKIDKSGGANNLVLGRVLNADEFIKGHIIEII